MATTELDILIAKREEYKAAGMTKLLTKVEEAIKNAANKEVVVNTPQGSITQPKKETTMPNTSTSTLKEGYRIVVKTCSKRNCHAQQRFQTNAPRGTALKAWFCADHNFSTSAIDYSLMSTKQLKNLATKRNIAGRSKMQRDQLIKALSA